ncbi:cupin domain-containing protein [Proteiniclasticum ruminis]|uniref:Cupin domain-containing protein n=1 Tax=Proteiniclasticum ruminis TaxID=398199 RepID=A0A1I5CIW5_9CLOT|nr:cupin domain-containing protein [Proteiniclasticum ruminis]SFN86955.1 Cupin domain-containing protein [Proteiniclasticum ruminis]
MYHLNENDREYRFGDSGPKYLMKGPRSNFALVQFMPGQDFPNHYHNIMEENFYMIEGELEFIINGELIVAKQGDFIHVEPKEHHYVRNASNHPAKMTSSLAPYQEIDKVEAPLEENLKMKEAK